MPLLRGLARTAAIAGTATAVSNRVSRRQAGRWAQQDQPAPAAGPEPPAQQAPAPAAPPSTEDRLEQLRQLGELKTSGVLTDEEFTEQKHRILYS
jgi:putative oligomerization/nucleic acid binding protein